MTRTSEGLSNGAFDATRERAGSEIDRTSRRWRRESGTASTMKCRSARPYRAGEDSAGGVFPGGLRGAAGSIDNSAPGNTC